MRRRDFIVLLSSAAATWPLAARAQSALPVIGFLDSGSPVGMEVNLAGFYKGLAESGFTEGKNVAIEYRWAEDHNDRLPALAAELVRRPVAVIAATRSPAPALAAKAATSTIPIVFQTGSDPIKDGLVASLNRPGGNVTGVTRQTLEMTPKRFELISELTPKANSVGLLVNPNGGQAATQVWEMQKVARERGLALHIANASNNQELDSAIAATVQSGAAVLIEGNDPLFIDRRKQIVALTTSYKIPTIFFERDFSRRWRLDELFSQLCGLVPAGRRLCRPHSQGRQARRPAGAATDQIRAGHQSQDRQGDRPYDSADSSRARRRGDRMRRREFIALLGSATALWPLTARAQKQQTPTIGILSGETPELWATRMQAFRDGLGQTGFAVGQNVAIEYRWAEDHVDRLPALAADLVRHRVAAIVLGGVPAMRAAMSATMTIPILFETGVDPVTAGFVASLNRPGGNVTGVANLSVELGFKRLELLRQIVPTAHAVGLLVDPTNDSLLAEVTQMRTVAAQLGLVLHVLNASTERDFDAVFDSLNQLKAGGLVIANTGFFNARAAALGALTLRHAIPAIFQTPQFAAAGGLASYSTSILEGFRLLGVYAGRILKGQKAAELPVQQPTKFEFIINLKTAKTLGLTVPPTLLAIADEVIE